MKAAVAHISQGCGDPRPRVSASPYAAFTLLEILLATAIFSIVVLAISTIFFAALHLRKTTTEALNASLPVEQALSILRKDLQNVVPPGGVLAGHFRSEGPADLGFGSSSVTGSGASTSGSAQTGSGSTRSGSSVRGGLDFFSSTGLIRNYQVGGDIQEVNYQLMEPSDSEALGSDLVRSVTRNLLSFSSAEPETQRLLSNVESLEFEFYDGMEWRNVWDTSQTDTNLPSAVRIRLLQAVPPEFDAQREPVEMIVVLHSQKASETATSTEEQTTQSGGTQ